jgi:hypothetical protein
MEPVAQSEPSFLSLEPTGFDVCRSDKVGTVTVPRYGTVYGLPPVAIGSLALSSPIR